MRCKAVKILVIALFTVALALVRQGIAFMQREVGFLHGQAAVINENAIDPSALFYTESPLALQAEKKVRGTVEQVTR